MGKARGEIHPMSKAGEAAAAAATAARMRTLPTEHESRRPARADSPAPLPSGTFIAAANEGRMQVARPHAALRKPARPAAHLAVVAGGVGTQTGP